MVCDADANDQSDLDLAILTTDELNSLQLWNHRCALTQSLHVEIDLVDLASVPTVFQYQIITTGVRIWADDFSFSESFEDRTYQLYLTLNDDRKYILEDIAKSGSIYGWRDHSKSRFFGKMHEAS